MRHQIMRVSLNFQIILSSSDFLAYLAWQPLLNLNPQNCSSFLSFVVKYIKTQRMQCSLKLELFFIAMGNSGFEWIEQILEIFVEPLSQLFNMAGTSVDYVWILKSCKNDNTSDNYGFWSMMRLARSVGYQFCKLLLGNWTSALLMSKPHIWLMYFCRPH